MGNKQTTKKQDIEKTSTFKKKEKILGEMAIENLKADWIHVKGVKSWAEIDPNTSSIDIKEFRQLMNNAISDKELNALFGLYDFNHDGTITWKEYICVIALIMAGSVQEKIRLIFNCFDDDGNGVLSKDEFLKAAKRFSDTDKNVSAFSEKVFKACDANGDGEVSYKEFANWVIANPEEFEEFAGVLNILGREDS